MKTNGNDNLGVPEHIGSEDLIAYLDGELAREFTNEIRRHLESCWDCRNTLTAVERSIERFLDLRRGSLIPRDIPPAGPAIALFEKRLNAHQPLNPAQSFFRRLSDGFERSFGVDNFTLGKNILLVRGLAVIVLIAVVAALILFSGRLNRVSAGELLLRSKDAEAAKLSQTLEPVVHQRITVKSSRSAAPASFEVWNDTINGRSTIRNASEEIPDATSTEGTVQDLRSVLRNNNMNESQPLTAASYKVWSDSLSEKQEQVERSDDVLAIDTTPAALVGIGRITSSKMTFRYADYHPESLVIHVRSSEGDVRFDLTETAYDVASLHDIDPAIFATTSIQPEQARSAIAVTHAMEPTPSVEDKKDSVLNLTPVNPEASAMPLFGLEVEVLKALDSVGALAGDQVGITRSGGRLRIQGIVDSSQRKNEILGALSSVRNQPDLTIDIQTAVEAAAHQRRVPSTATVGAAEVMRAEVEQQLPVEAELRSYLSKQGVPTDRMNVRVTDYANSVLDRSRELRRDAFALKQITTRFSSADLGKMDVAKQNEWRAMVRSKAEAISQDVRSLGSQIGEVGLGSPQLIASPAVGDLESSVASMKAKELFTLASTTDTKVSQSFTISPAGDASVKSAAFWRDLAQIAALAAQLKRF